MHLRVQEAKVGLTISIFTPQIMACYYKSEKKPYNQRKSKKEIII